MVSDGCHLLVDVWNYRQKCVCVCGFFFSPFVSCIWASLVAQTLKNLPAKLETGVQSLGQEDPLEKGMATHSSILAWEIPWAEEPSGLHTVHGVAKNQTQLSNERNACGINLVPPLETEHKPSVVKAWGVLTPGPPGNSTKLCPSIRPINMTLVLQACVYIYHSYWSLGKECLGAFWHGPQMF